MLEKVEIKKLIADRGLKISFLIDKTGYSRGTFYKYINGETEPPENFKFKLAKVLSIPIVMLD